eukprot:scpid70333/ scgid19552/ Inner membrane protein yhjX
MARSSELMRVRPWLVMFGGLLTHLTLGSYYTFGNMSPYITSYIRLRGNQPDATFGAAIWIYTVQIMGMSVAMFFGGYLGEKLGSRWTTMIGSLLMSAGVALSYYTCHDLYLMMLTYGLMVGVGTGIGYTNPLTCAMKWLPNHRGMASGIVVSGFGAGSTIFTQVQTIFINPEDIPASLPSTESDCIQTEKYFDDKDVLDRVPQVFLVLAGVYAGMQIIGCLLIADPPENVQARKPATETESAPLLSVKGSDTVVLEEHYQIDFTLFKWRFKLGKIHEASTKESLFGRSLSVKEAIRTYLFPLLWVTFLFNGQATVYLVNSYKTFGQTFISSDHFLANVGTASSPMNAVTRIFWGVVADRYSYKPAMLTLGSMCTVLLILYYFTSFVNHYAYAICTPALFFCIGGNYSLWPFVTTSTFGPAHAAFLYGLLFSSQIVGGMVAALAHTQLTCAIGYGGLFALCTGLQVLSMLLTVLYPDPAQRVQTEVDLPVSHTPSAAAAA